MWTQPMTETPRITILKNNSQIKKNKARNMKYVVIVWKPIPFFEDWSWDFKEIGVFILETRWVWERFNRGWQWIVTKVRVKTQNKFLKLSLKQKTCVFFDSISPELLRKKKLSKCFSRLEVLLMRELRNKPRKSLSTLATGTSTHE